MNFCTRSFLFGFGISLFFGCHSRAADASQLPLSEVVLYSSGVGFFERLGEIEGKKEIEMRFKVDDINDLLKSLVVQDLNGGHVSTVTYDSRDPLAKTLKSFGLDLTENPGRGELLNQLRGERVELQWPGKVTGIIVGVEKKQQPAGENKVVEVEYLNVLTDDGLQSIALAQIQKIKMLSERLNTEFRQALEVLATGHDTQKKTVGILFDGDGKRKVSVSYIAQTPVWKTSYRLILSEKAKPFLQGWAIVENTSDEDWDHVRLSLVSGRPVSFVMDLYQPLYSTRPVVEPERYLSLRPQVYGEAMDAENKPAAAPSLALQGGAMPASPMVAGRYFMQEDSLKRKAGATLALRTENELADSASLGAAIKSERLGELDRNTMLESLGAGAQTAQMGELFQYEIKSPVTLARQKSAMLPIINQDIDGEKISIYNQRVQSKYPLNGFRLRNTSTLHLMQGPITVFDASTYAGDARIEDLAPGQERLISYGLDLKTEVEPQSKGGPNDLVSVKIRKGTLIATRKSSQEWAYNVRNRDTKPKTVLVEHPFRADWKLAEPKTAPERTREVYRFPVHVAPDKTEKLTVKEERQFDERVQLVSSANDAIQYYIRAPKVSSKAQSALQQILGFRDKLSQTTADRSRREQQSAAISTEQGRIRENMQRLNSTSDLYTRYVKKLDQQETELETLRQQIETLKDTEARQQRELNDYLQNLDLE